MYQPERQTLGKNKEDDDKMKSSKRKFVSILTLLLALTLVFSLVACGKKDPGKTPNPGPNPEPPVVKTDAFESDTAFYLDYAVVPTFGAGFTSSVITMKKDGTFTVEHSFNAMGAVLAPVFLNVNGTYKLNDNKSAVTLTVAQKFYGNQSEDGAALEDPDAAKTVTYDLETLDDGSYKFTHIFNGKLAMPYYSNSANWGSLKEFEYPTALGEKVVFASVQNFVADVSEAEVGPLGKVTEIIYSFTDDGQYACSVSLSGEKDGKPTSAKVESKGAYKLDNAENPTEISLLEEGKTDIVKYAMAVVSEGESSYITMVYVNATLGTYTLYNDVEKIPATTPYPEALGTLNAFEKKTVFKATVAALGNAEVVITMRVNGAYEMTIAALSMTFKGHYNLVEDGETLKIKLLEEGESKEVAERTITVTEGLMSFGYPNASLGDITVTEVK